MDEDKWGGQINACFRLLFPWCWFWEGGSLEIVCL